MLTRSCSLFAGGITRFPSDWLVNYLDAVALDDTSEHQPGFLAVRRCRPPLLISSGGLPVQLTKCSAISVAVGDAFMEFSYHLILCGDRAPIRLEQPIRMTSPHVTLLTLREGGM